MRQGARGMKRDIGKAITTSMRIPVIAKRWCLLRVQTGPVATDGLDLLRRVLINGHTGGKSVRR